MILTAYFMYVVLDKLLMMLTVETRTDQTNIRIDFHMNIPKCSSSDATESALSWSVHHNIQFLLTQAKQKKSVQSKSFNQKHIILVMCIIWRENLQACKLHCS